VEEEENEFAHSKNMVIILIMRKQRKKYETLNIFERKRKLTF